MRIACLGGGPAGFYFAIAIKLRRPEVHVDVFERNRSGDTFGWGVVFSDQTLANLEANDPVSAGTIAESFAHWDDIEVRIGAESIVSHGHGFIGIGRKHLLRILQQRAIELGACPHFETEFGDDLSRFAEYDLVIAADGANSQIRTRYAEHFDVDVQVRRNKFTWLGTTKLFDAFGFFFEETPFGWMWAHAYRFDATHSTFIVECSPETWKAAGLDGMSQAESTAMLEQVFARHLDGHSLMGNAAHLRGSAAWINFRRVLCGRWSFDNIVLLGDAAHTAHFSIGSGTKLALEDAIKLAQVLEHVDLRDPASLSEALVDYQRERSVEVLKIQNSARNSTEWFETLARYIGFDLPQFGYSLLTRSQRVSHENLRLRDKAWLEDVERWLWQREAGNPVDADQAAADGVVPQPIFAPLRLRELTLANRIVVAPVLTYEATRDGAITPFHHVHYGARALGGAGLVMTETLAVAPEGRATEGCPALADDAQTEAWRQIVAFAHDRSGARMCAQIGHAGARGACRVPHSPKDYDRPLDEPWPLISASTLPWAEGGLVPTELDEAGMERVLAQFVATAGRADDAGFDMLEVMAGHGMLLASFISPVTNHRADAYGESLENRLRFPLRVIAAVRAAWPQHKPLAVRISANDWVGDRGITPADAVQIAIELKRIGADLVDVSAGETNPAARPTYGRMFQTPFADRVRNEAGIRTIAVGNITDADQANSIVASGRADLVALGRPHLLDPAWTLHAAAAARQSGVFVPPAYQLGWTQAANLSGRVEKVHV